LRGESVSQFVISFESVSKVKEGELLQYFSGESENGGVGRLRRGGALFKRRQRTGDGRRSFCIDEVVFAKMRILD